MHGDRYELVRACMQRPEALDPVELELQVVLKSLMWVLGMELGRLQEMHSYLLSHLFSFQKILQFINSDVVQREGKALHFPDTPPSISIFGPCTPS